MDRVLGARRATESMTPQDSRSRRHWKKACATHRVTLKVRLAGGQRAAETPRWEVVVLGKFSLELSAEK